jgi:hypothetical protein
MRWCACVCWTVVWLALLIGGPLTAQDPAPEGDGSTLEDLDWMVGDWVLVPDDEVKTKQAGAMRMSVRWDEGRAFLVREATLTPPEESGEPSRHAPAADRLGSARRPDPLVEFFNRRQPRRGHLVLGRRFVGCAGHGCAPRWHAGELHQYLHVRRPGPLHVARCEAGAGRRR